jgi:aldose 1-epimerase
VLTSGDQIEIASGAHRAIVATVGATLRTYDVDARPVLDGFDADEVCPDGRGQVLMPWPNRVAGGQYAFAGQPHRLPIDEPARGHAIHGLVRWAEWRVEDRRPDHVVLRHRLCARPGYPFPLELTVEYALSSDGLSVRFGAVNAGGASCPFGAGAHPYFRLADARADALELRVPARAWLPMDALAIPRERAPVDGTAADYRRPRVIGSAALDHAFAQLERDARGVARVRLRHGGEAIELWADRAFDFIQVFTGDALPNAERRRRSVAIEPMTCAPNAFNSGDGLLVLAPGESFEGRWGVVARAA